MINLDKKLAALPAKPGMYMFKNAAGEVIYVGKAKRLRSRVRSYFAGRAGDIKTARLRAEIADFSYVIVSSELESLMLENNFIKRYLPRFNVRLRDDKNYQFIKIDYRSEIPQIYTVRRLTKEKGAKYYGPYTSGLAVKQTLHMLKRLFPLCGNKKTGNRPCFQYHLDRCPGVCVGKASLGAYRKSFREIEAFLSHRQSAVLQSLNVQMRKAADNRKFEKAAQLRDRIVALRAIWERQKIIFTKPYSADFFSVFAAGEHAVVHLFRVRGGRIVHQEHFEVESAGENEPQILEAFLQQYYEDASDIPKEVYSPFRLSNKKLLERWLKLKIKVSTPLRGKKAQLLKLGRENAQDYYGRNFASFEAALQSLQKILRLPRYPARMEAYDISNIQGFLPVGSMVVFENGKPKKSAYRKFKIQTEQGPNDFTMMKEILARRIQHLGGPDLWPEPQLLVIDGGKGQLNAALAALAPARKDIPIIGLAKRLEEIYVPGVKNPIVLPAQSPILQLLQRLRDEAHRFAITFYRGRHRSAGLRSRLDEIPGVGPKTKKKLLQKFGSVDAIRKASAKQISEITSKKMARTVKHNL